MPGITLGALGNVCHCPQRQASLLFSVYIRHTRGSERPRNSATSHSQDSIPELSLREALSTKARRLSSAKRDPGRSWKKPTLTLGPLSHTQPDCRF